MIISGADQYEGPNLFLNLEGILGRQIFVKCEGLNLGYSIKLRTAKYMVDVAESEGRLVDGDTIVESSSGNLGVALALVAASRGYRFHCVTDPNCNRQAHALMVTLGATVEIVSEDRGGNFLRARKDRVAELCADRRGYVWLDQYSNEANPMAHFRTTARAIADEFPHLDVLFVGAGTGGTVTGCARYMAENRPKVRVIAVDSVGSVNFGGTPGRRHLPGLGAGVPMPLLTNARVHGVEWVREEDSVRMCRRLGLGGYVAGGSTGAVVTGAAQWLDRNDSNGKLTAVAVGPDLGPAYLDTVFDDEWCAERFSGAWTSEEWEW